MKKTIKLSALLLSAAMAVTALGAAACGSKEEAIEPDRQAILSALEESKTGAYELLVNSTHTVDSIGDSFNDRNTTFLTLEIQAYEQGAFADVLESKRSYSKDNLTGRERETNSYHADLLRGEYVYQGWGDWTDDMSSGDILSALGSGNPLHRLSMEHYSLPETELFVLSGALAEAMGAEIEKDADGYTVTVDFVAGTERAINELIRIANSRADAPDMTVGEVLEDEYLAAALPAFLASYSIFELQNDLTDLIYERYGAFISSFPVAKAGERTADYFNRLLDSSELYSQILTKAGITDGANTLRKSSAQKLFGTSEDAADRLKEIKENVEAHLLAELFDYNINTQFESCSLSFTLTASVGADQHLRQMEYSLTENCVQLLYGNRYPAQRSATMTVTQCDEDPALLSLTGLQADVGELPRPGAYENEKSGFFDDNALGRLQYTEKGKVTVSDDCMAEITVELALSLPGEEEVQRYTETRTVDLLSLREDYSDYYQLLFAQIEFTANGGTHTVDTGEIFYIRIGERYSLDRWYEISFASFFYVKVPIETRIVTL